MCENFLRILGKNAGWIFTGCGFPGRALVDIPVEVVEVGIELLGKVRLFLKSKFNL